jgi:hypothetical protein
MSRTRWAAEPPAAELDEASVGRSCAAGSSGALLLIGTSVCEVFAMELDLLI